MRKSNGQKHVQSASRKNHLLNFIKTIDHGMEGNPGAKNVTRLTRESIEKAEKKQRKSKGLKKIKEKNGNLIVKLDFSKFPETYEAIKRVTDQELRTIENQILYWLINMEPVVDSVKVGGTD